jgi:nicotinamidase-related amidase
MKTILELIGVLFLLFIVYFINGYQKLYKVSKVKPINKKVHQKEALLIIDMQKDVTQMNGRSVMDLKQTDSIIENINRLIDHAEELRIKVIFFKHEFENIFLLKLLTKGALQKGNPETEIDERLKVGNNTVIIKNSAEAFKDTSLDNLLNENHIGHLYMTGIDAEYCVAKTVQAALERQYNVSVISDAIGARTIERRDKKIEDFNNAGVEIITTKQLLNKLNKVLLN